jgi:hypothetical protein
MPIITIGIAENGPVAEVIVGPSVAGTLAYEAPPQRTPAPVRGLGLIDTGSTLSFVDTQMAGALSLAPTGYTAISTVTPGSTDHFMSLHDAALTIVGHGGVIEFASVHVVVCDLSALGVSVLIGRDVLDQCLLQYHGPASLCTLAR